MCMLERRLQILIDEQRYRRLATRARETNRSVASLIREAVDRAYPDNSGARRKAAERILAAPRDPTPSVEALRAELDELRGRRG
jgi:hypothetical protein